MPKGLPAVDVALVVLLVPAPLELVKLLLVVELVAVNGLAPVAGMPVRAGFAA